MSSCRATNAKAAKRVRDAEREAARMSGLEFSRWVERAVRQTMARESAVLPCPQCGTPSDSSYEALLADLSKRGKPRLRTVR